MECNFMLKRELKKGKKFKIQNDLKCWENLSTE